jgi:hypothetical protein
MRWRRRRACFFARLDKPRGTGAGAWIVVYGEKGVVGGLVLSEWGPLMAAAVRRGADGNVRDRGWRSVRARLRQADGFSVEGR